MKPWLDIPGGRIVASTPRTHGRFVAMDGLRGVAALAVVLFHGYRSGGLLPNAPLAVDLFFILSGFVVAFAYDDRIATMGPGDFLRARFVRLYPMLFVAAVAAIAVAFLHNLLNPAGGYALRDIAIAGGASLLMIPYFGGGLDSEGIFPLNPPMWSLFFEIAANLVYAFTARWLTLPVLVAVSLLCLSGMIACGPLGGGGVDIFWSGFPRVGAGFFSGVMLFRLWASGRLPRWRASIYVVSAGILALFAVPVPLEGWLLLPALAFLWLVVMATIQAPPARIDPLCAWLGRVSYPVYLVHWLTMYVATWLGRRAGLVGDGYAMVVGLHLLAIPFIAQALIRVYERPVWMWLAGKVGVELRRQSL